MMTAPREAATPVSVIIGAGPVGLALATRLDSLGHQLIITDISASRLSALRAGECPWISDPQLRAQVQARHQNWTLLNPAELASRHENDRPAWSLLAVCVGTQPESEQPSSEQPGCEQDLSCGTGQMPNPDPTISPEVIGALQLHVPALRRAGTGGPLVALRSTARPGTARYVQTQTGARVVAWPEFLRADQAWADALNPARSVMGGVSADCAALRALTEEGGAAYNLNWEEAELSKLAANALISLHLAGLHWLRDLGGAHLIQPEGTHNPDWLRAAGHDPRFGATPTGAAWEARSSWGGHCLPKDLKILQETARAWGEQSPLLEAALDAQRKQNRTPTQRAEDQQETVDATESP